MDLRPPAPKPRAAAGAGSALLKQALQNNASLATSSIPEGEGVEASAELCTSDAQAAGGAQGPAAPEEAADWRSYFDRRTAVEVASVGTFNVYEAGSSGPVLFCIHGGGYTGVSWALAAEKLKDRCRIVAPDLRGHGLTSTGDDLDLSKETLARDAVELWRVLFGSASERVATVLVGHSMGAAVAVWAAAGKQIPSLDGLVVIDVVEGTAMAALPHMAGVLSSRPAAFPSAADAVQWALRSGMSRCRQAAALSVPSQLRPCAGGSGCEWITPLQQSARFWEGWYRGMSDAFLAAPAPKLLMLAGSDRLDTALTIGQMQGKFQLVLLPAAGHAVHEDEAAKAADALAQFLRRFRVGEPPLQFPRAAPGVRPVLPLVAGPTL